MPVQNVIVLDFFPMGRQFRHLASKNYMNLVEL